MSLKRKRFFTGPQKHKTFDKKMVEADDKEGLRVVHFLKSGRERFSLLFPIQRESIHINGIIDLCNSTDMLKPIGTMKLGVEKLGLKYPGFKTFEQYIEHSSADDTRRVIKGIIRTVIELQVRGIAPQLSPNRVVAIGQRRGSILQTRVISSNLTNSECTQHFKDLASFFDSIVERVDIHLRKDEEFKILLECMKLANTQGKRTRLLHCPYLLSAREKLYKFMPMIEAAMSSYPGYAAVIKGKIHTRNWKRTVQNFGCPEIEAVFLARNYGRDEFIKFARNFALHVHERRKNLMDISRVREKLMAEGKLEAEDNKMVLPMADLLREMKEPSEVQLASKMNAKSPKHLRKLLEIVNRGVEVDPTELLHQMLRLIESVHPNLISKVFYESYEFAELDDMDCTLED